MSGVNNVGSQAYTSAVNKMNQFGSNVNIPEMGLLIQMERHSILQTQVQDQFKDMQKRNEWLKGASDMLNNLRALRPDSEGGTIPDNKKAEFEAIKKFFGENGVKVPDPSGDGKMKQNQIDTMINNLKTTIDTVNTNSQLDMVRMQGLMDKMNQATDFMTNWISKNSKTMDSIVGNIR